MVTEQTPLIPSIQEVDRLHIVLPIIGILILTFIASIDSTIVATLIGTIGSSLESMQLVSWVGTSYLLSRCTFTPLYGGLISVTGRRKTILCAAALFGVSTILCGVAQNMPQLIALRAIAGLGGSGMTVVGSIVLTDIVPVRSRGFYVGVGAVLHALGGAIGAPFGGWIGDMIGWRAAFLCQFPFLVVAILLLYLKVSEPTIIPASASNTLCTQLKHIDYAGATTLVCALLGALLGITIKTTTNHGWNDPYVWGFLITGLLCGCIFCVIELKFAVEPIMPISALIHRTTGFVVLNQFLLSMFMMSGMYNIPLYYTAACLRTATEAGTNRVPASVGIAMGALFSGWYIQKTGQYYKLLFIASLGPVISALVLTSWYVDLDTPDWVLYTTLIPSSVGMAISITTSFTALTAGVSHADIPLVTGLLFLFRQLGEVLGVSLTAALTQVLLKNNLRQKITGPGAEVIIARILVSTEYIRTLTPEIQHKAMESWMGALHIVFWCQVGLGIAVFFTALPIEQYCLPDRNEER
ncbi:MFS general substrate transporter [Mycena crocata]|nr:MFS general substrate transporter [Mycena crocata]